jgi:hypothetical protein
MAIGIRIKLAGITQEQFDAGHDQINPDRTPPKGLILHASGPVDGGWCILDFWESRQDFDAFAQGVLAHAGPDSRTAIIRYDGEEHSVPVNPGYFLFVVWDTPFSHDPAVVRFE